jgi:hypothetical protein
VITAQYDLNVYIKFQLILLFKRYASLMKTFSLERVQQFEYIILPEASTLKLELV